MSQKSSTNARPKQAQPVKLEGAGPRASAPHEGGAPLSWASTTGLGVALGIVLGLGLLGLGVSTLARAQDLPMPLAVALSLGGGVLMATCWFTMQRHRAAWAFATALSATAALVFLFSGPKIASGLEVSLAIAMIPCLLSVVVATLLGQASSEMPSA